MKTNKEEPNIVIQPYMKLEPVFHRYDNEIILIPFISHFLSGEIKLTEHKTYTWLPFIELLTLDWAADDLKVVNQIY